MLTSGTSLASENDDECGSSSRGPRRRTLAVDTTVTTVEAATPERMAWLSPEENLKKSVSASMRPETDRLARTGSGGRTGSDSSGGVHKDLNFKLEHYTFAGRGEFRA